MKNDPTSSDYKKVLAMIQIVSESQTALARLQSDVDAEMQSFFDCHRETYADLQTSIADATAAAEAICRSHPEWFTESKSVKTPFGAAKLQATTRLDIPNEELTIALIEAAQDEADPDYAILQRVIRVTRSVDREVLATFTDQELRVFRVQRVEGQSFTIKSAKVDLGKAISAGEEKEKAAA